MSDENAPAARTLIANERAKLTATYVNGVAVGFSIIGGVAPIFSFIFASETTRPTLTTLLIGMLICQTVSAALHLVARRTLKGLRS